MGSFAHFRCPPTVPHYLLPSRYNGVAVRKGDKRRKHHQPKPICNNCTSKLVPPNKLLLFCALGSLHLQGTHITAHFPQWCCTRGQQCEDQVRLPRVLYFLVFDCRILYNEVDDGVTTNNSTTIWARHTCQLSSPS